MEGLSKILEDGVKLTPVICHNQADEYVQQGKVVLLPKSWICDHPSCRESHRSWSSSVAVQSPQQ